MSGTHRDLLFGSKSCCFACKKHRWGLGPIESGNSDTRHAGLYAESHRWGLGPKDMCNCGHKVAVLHAQNDRWGLRPIEARNFRPKAAVLNAQNQRWGLKLIETSYSGANHAVLYAQNDRWGLVPIETCMLVQKSLFSMQKPQKKAGTNRDYVLKSLICMHKTTVKGWNQHNLFILVPSTLLYVFKSTV